MLGDRAFIFSQNMTLTRALVFNKHCYSMVLALFQTIHSFEEPEDVWFL